MTSLDRAGRLLVVGAVNVDLVVATDRLPGPGETVVGPTVTRHGGGKGANAAVAAARAGAGVRYCGAVGSDDMGASALAELRDSGVDVTDVDVLDGVATGMALIVVDPHGENQIAVGAGANAVLDADEVRAAVDRAARIMGGIDICVNWMLTWPSRSCRTTAGRVCSRPRWLRPTCTARPGSIGCGCASLIAMPPVEKFTERQTSALPSGRYRFTGISSGTRCALRTCRVSLAVAIVAPSSTML